MICPRCEAKVLYTVDGKCENCKDDPDLIHEIRKSIKSLRKPAAKGWRRGPPKLGKCKTGLVFDCARKTRKQKEME